MNSRPPAAGANDAELEVAARSAGAQEELLLVVLIVEDGSHDGGHENRAPGSRSFRAASVPCAH